MRGYWDSLVVNNPMMGEIRRVVRRLTGPGTTQLGYLIMASIAGVIYLGLMTIFIQGRNFISPFATLAIWLGINCLVAPAVAHPLVAGEREKRTWDLLLAAPVTKAQIVAAKLIAVLLVLAIVGVLMIGGVIITSIKDTASSFSSDVPDPSGVFLGMLVVIAFSCFAATFSLFISARVRRPYVALGTTLGVFLVWLALVPVFLAPGDGMFVLGLLNPFVAITGLGSRDPAFAGLAFTSALMNAFLYAVLAVVFAVYTERTLLFADGEVRFLPSKKQ